jgi:hypothetical protein
MKNEEPKAMKYNKPGIDYTLLLLMVIYSFALIFSVSFLSNFGLPVQPTPQDRVLLEANRF